MPGLIHHFYEIICWDHLLLPIIHQHDKLPNGKGGRTEECHALELLKSKYLQYSSVSIRQQCNKVICQNIVSAVCQIVSMRLLDTQHSHNDCEGNWRPTEHILPKKQLLDEAAEKANYWPKQYLDKRHNHVNNQLTASIGALHPALWKTVRWGQIWFDTSKIQDAKLSKHKKVHVTGGRRADGHHATLSKACQHSPMQSMVTYFFFHSRSHFAIAIPPRLASFPVRVNRVYSKVTPGTISSLLFHECTTVPWGRRSRLTMKASPPFVTLPIGCACFSTRSMIEMSANSLFISSSSMPPTRRTVLLLALSRRGGGWDGTGWDGLAHTWPKEELNVEAWGEKETRTSLCGWARRSRDANERTG